MDDETAVAEHDHINLRPGQPCPACHRPIPKIRADSLTGPRRQVLSIAIPAGEEGTLDELLIAVVDKYREQWPREYAAMRNNIGLEQVGGRAWKYHVIHFALYATLMVPGLDPAEEGSPDELS